MDCASSSLHQGRIQRQRSALVLDSLSVMGYTVSSTNCSKNHIILSPFFSDIGSVMLGIIYGGDTQTSDLAYFDDSPSETLLRHYSKNLIFLPNVPSGHRQQVESREQHHFNLQIHQTPRDSLAPGNFSPMELST